MKKIILLMFIGMVFLGFSASSLATLETLKHWDEIVNQITEKSPLSDRDKDRLMAYLCFAQSFNGKDGRNLDAISLHVIQLFYPNYQADIADNSSNSNPSVLFLIDQRFKEEQKKYLTHHPLKTRRRGLERKSPLPWIGNPYLETLDFKISR